MQQNDKEKKQSLEHTFCIGSLVILDISVHYIQYATIISLKIT